MADQVLTSSPIGPPMRIRTLQDRYSWLLLMRFAVMNLLIAALVGVAWQMGYLEQLIATDKWHMVKLNCAVFLLGLGIAGWRAWWLAGELNSNDGKRWACITGKMTLDMLKMRIGIRIAPVRHIASYIVLIGLAGTIIGFIIALSGVDVTAATNAAAITPMISTLLLGVAISLYKTLVGSLLNIWLMLNYRLLEAGAVHLVGAASDVRR